jgi:hypothetical protein
MEKTMYKAPKNGSHFDGEQPMLNSKGQPMRRVFVEWVERTADEELECRSQIWRCPETGEECRDDWQIHCHNKAVEMAAMSDSPVLFYHTCAWRTDLPEWSATGK